MRDLRRRVLALNRASARDGVNGYQTPEKGIWYYLLWLPGLLGLTSLVGFFLALNAFFIAFLRVEAKTSWKQTIILTALSDVMLMFLSWLMTLDLPWGLLQQNFEDLPWPIGSI